MNRGLMIPFGLDSIWWIKITGVTLVGALWLLGAVPFLWEQEPGMRWVSIGLWTVVIEQILMPISVPKYWKAYTGIGVGVGLFFPVSWLTR